MTVLEIYDIIDKLYPFILSKNYTDAFGGFDNSGVVLDCANDVTGVLFTLDFCDQALQFAQKENLNLIITHHPALYAPQNQFLTANKKDLAFLQAVRLGVSIISMHLNLDVAIGGLDDMLPSVLQPNSSKIIQKIDGGGYGRLIDINPITLSEIANLYANICKTQKIRTYGDGQTIITRAATFSGSGYDQSVIKSGAQVVILSEIKHNVLLDLHANGVCAIDIPHYSQENYSFKKIYQTAKDKLNTKCCYFEINQLL